MHDSRPLFLAVTSVLASIALAGCSSGGGGVSSTPSTLPPKGATSTSVTPVGPVDVRVAVADSGFDIAAITNSERVIDSLNVHTGGSDVSGGNEWHGNVVSSVITGDELGRARLDLLKVEKDGVTLSSVLDYAIGVAAQRGARVINASFSQRFLASDPRLSFNGVTSAESYQRVVSANDGKGAVYVISAGNDGAAIDTQGRPIYASHPDLYSMMLIAVGTGSDGNIHPSSSYPGDDVRLQERAIATDYVNQTVGAQGTSISAARISEYAAGIISLWPHLSAQQASQRLLDTASQTSALFQQNSCGAAANVNCGAFYLGQGEADIDAALAPEGDLVVPQGERVAAGGDSAVGSFMQLSGAYGNALAASGVLDAVAVFDNLGRDYRMDFGHQAQQRVKRANQLRDQMERMSISSAQAIQTDAMEMDNYRFMVHSNNGGEVLSSRFDGSFGNSTLTAFNYAGDQIDPMSGYADSGMMPMISFQSGAVITQAFDNVNGVQSRYDVTDKFSLSASHWTGGVEDTMSFANDYSANRSDIGMTYQLTPAISVSTQIGRLEEQNGLLGANGSGALGFDEHNQMTFVGAGLQANVGDGFTAFAEFEHGRGNADGSGLVTRIKDINAQEMALGLQWQKSDERAALTLRQPLRIDSATAELNVPIARTLSGEVLRESREVSLSPSGRQMDIELGYAFKPSERSQLQFNLLHTLEPDHDADASSDSAAMVNYLVAW
ncbi:S8 family peptidase [Vreelandella sp. V005]|uniref:S8 family peptidase n=1 Tax=Vreelandella sp. V005 TaxID=3459608 RepID=UPI0040442B49